MEIKSNVKQRRMNRMKQISESSTPSTSRSTWVRDKGKQPEREDQQRPEAKQMERLDHRFQDPEIAWKERDRFRNERAIYWRSNDSSEQDYRLDASSDSTDKGLLSPPTRKQLWIKLGVSTLIFALSFGMFQVDHPYTDKGRIWITNALTEDYNFARAAVWYEQRFSSLPAILPAFWRQDTPEIQRVSTIQTRQLYAPVKGILVMGYTEVEPVIKLETSATEVKALDSGHVVTVQYGNDGLVQVIVQHADGLQAVYSGLSQTTLNQNDWIKGGEMIGRIALNSVTQSATLLFGLKKDNQWIDPMDVVSFD